MGGTPSVFSPRIIQGMTRGRSLGMACGHIKAFGLLPFPHQRGLCAEGLYARENTDFTLHSNGGWANIRSINIVHYKVCGLSTLY